MLFVQIYDQFHKSYQQKYDLFKCLPFLFGFEDYYNLMKIRTKNIRFEC